MLADTRGTGGMPDTRRRIPGASQPSHCAHNALEESERRGRGLIASLIGYKRQGNKPFYYTGGLRQHRCWAEVLIVFYLARAAGKA